MPSRLGNVGLDGASDRLIRAAQAVASAEILPKESARSLLGTAKAVRLFLEARDIEQATELLDWIDGFMTPGDDVTPSLAAAFDRHIKEVRRYLAS